MTAIVRACDAAIMATCGDGTPDARHIANMMNKSATDLTLYFMTSDGSPKVAQLKSNNRCCLYYFDDKTRHAVRLYGKIEFVTDMETRRKYWRPEFEKFGYAGPDSSDFVLMRFVADGYKYYVGEQPVSGDL